MKIKHVIIVGLAGFAMAGCTNNIENYSKNMARHVCTNMKECDKALYEEAYNGDRGRCRDEVEAQLLASGRELEAAGCTFNKDAAGDCYKAFRKNKRECNPPESAFSACQGVYQCPQGEQYSEDLPNPNFLADFPYVVGCDEIDLDEIDQTVGQQSAAQGLAPN